MTVEEAINELREASDNEVRYGDTTFHYPAVMKRIEAFDMAIKALEKQPCEEENPNCTECRYYDKEKHHCPRFCRVIENTVAEITSEQARWIPANEKLPKIGKDVLATDGVEMFVAWIAEITRGKYEWQSFDENYAKYTLIKAWMPLPKPYVESEDKE